MCIRDSDDPIATRDDGSCYFYTSTNNDPGYVYGGGGYSGGGYSGGGHSGTDIGFPAITNSDGGMNIGPSGEEIFGFCCLPLIVFITIFSMTRDLNKTKKLQPKDGDEKPKSKDKKMQ